MRRDYSRITPCVVHSCAYKALEENLGFSDYKESVRVGQMLNLLLLMAALRRTLFAVISRYFRSHFSHETARCAVYANLTTREQLIRGLVDALHHVAAFDRRERKRTWTVAIDLHYQPYYGCAKDPDVIGGQKKHGTKLFHCYATAVLIHKRRRYTLGLIQVTKGLKPHQQVQALLDQIQARNLKVGGVVLDAGFDSGETILLLQQLKLNYTVPLRRKGCGTNRRNACFSQPSGTLQTVQWKTEKTNKAVSTRVLVWQNKDQDQSRVYAFCGWSQKEAVSELRRAYLARQRYRQRFGIETSYRQKNQGRGWTTSVNPDYRLLLEGVALLLRQVWVGLTQQIAKARGLTPTQWVSELPLNLMLEWLADHLRSLYPFSRQISLTQNVLTTTITR
jgi:hypothetical protein